MTWNLLTFIASFPSKSATHHTLVQILKTTYSSLQTQYPRKPPCFVLTTPSFSKYNSSLRTQLMHNSPKKTSQMLPFPSRLGQAHFQSAHVASCQLGKTFNLSRVMEDSGFSIYSLYWFPRLYSANESTCQCRKCRGCSFDSWVGTIPWVRNGYPLQYIGA